MALARFKDLCLDAVDPALVGEFWSRVLGRQWEPHADGDGVLPGPTPGHTIWVNRVPDPKSVKHRVHLDIYTRSLTDLTELGSRVLLPEGDDRRWTVMADPEGGEYCAFRRDELPPERLHGLVVDSVHPTEQARWWAGVLGGQVVEDLRGFATISDIPELPIATMDFVPVPEPKTVKNRIHWDIWAPVAPLIAAGATLLRGHDDEIRWDVLADPEGNEFCAFAIPAG
jgi:hypothetical protein